MKHASLIGPVAALMLFCSVPGFAAGEASIAGNDDRPELSLVLRISRQLVNDLTTQTTRRTTPVYMCVADSEIKGLAFTEAKSTVQFESDKSEANHFFVELRGTTVSRTVADRPPVQVFGSARMRFLLRKRVAFDGTKFSTQVTGFDGDICTSVDGIATPPGLAGLIVEIIATPQIRASQPIVAKAAYDDGRSQLITEFDKEVQRVIKELNTISPLEETAQKLFPQTKDWIYYPYNTATHLIIGVGPRNYRLPDLPVTSPSDARVEVWIRNKPETKGMIPILRLWRNASEQLEVMLPADIGKKLNFREGFRTQTVKEWFVIKLGGKVPPKEDEPSPVFVWRAIGNGGAPAPSGRPLFAQDRCPAETPALPTTRPTNTSVSAWRPIVDD
jgi:hypothetical protein